MAKSVFLEFPAIVAPHPVKTMSMANHLGNY